MLPLLSAIGAFAIGIGATILIVKIRDKRFVSTAKREYERIISNAKSETERAKQDYKIKLKEEMLHEKNEVEKEVREKRKEIQTWEKRIMTKEESIDKKTQFLDSKEEKLKQKEQEVDNKNQKIEEEVKKYKDKTTEVQAKLEKLTGMSNEEAKRLQIELIVEDARHDSAKKLKDIEDELKENAEKKATKIISTAVQRYAGDYTADRTISTILLPNEEMKGRIIGREGRNIRAIEAATGVDLIIDDTPETVVISGFDPVRREIARMTIDKLISDGRIHPGRIEEIAEKAEKEIQKEIKDAGEKALYETGLHGIHPEILRLIGSLKYRTSYSQNQYVHSLEVCFLAGLMASELGINPKLAKRAALLHDIGKALDHSVDGSHAMIGADFAKKYGETPEIVHAIRAHHEEEKPDSVLAVLVQAADALSGARPGARRDMLESYVSRVEDLEKLTYSFEGVEKAYAIQAGREIRVMVNSEKITDEKAILLSRDIAKKVEQELRYPGQVKVTVIRETRSIGIAKW